MIKYTKQENMRKNQSTVTDPEITQMLELVDKDIKTVIMNILCVFNNGEENTNV